MRYLLAIVFAMFLVSPLQANTFTLNSPGTNAPLSVIVIPDGSTITSEIYSPAGTTTATGAWTVNYVFADGFGFTAGDINDGTAGSIHFNVPVSNLTIQWHTSFIFSISGSGVIFNPPRCTPPFINCPAEGTATFTSDVSGFNWDSNHTGYGGVESMSYTVPELSSLALLPLGLIGILIARKRQTVS